MINSNICPFCKKDNNCKAGLEPKNCWCTKLNVPDQLRQLVPENLKMKACICEDCVKSFIKNKKKFQNLIKETNL